MEFVMYLLELFHYLNKQQPRNLGRQLDEYSFGHIHKLSNQIFL